MSKAFLNVAAIFEVDLANLSIKSVKNLEGFLFFRWNIAVFTVRIFLYSEEGNNSYEILIGSKIK